MVIAIMGLPGSGKSTLAQALGKLVGAHTLLEPDEQDWPGFVHGPHPNGAFTRLSWFRSHRVPMYYAAAHESSGGRTVILDFYYDKWCVGWLGRPGLGWLIEPEDPYMPVAKLLASVDAEVLPAADVVVMLEIGETHWREQLAARGRVIDNHSPFLRSHESQGVFIETGLTLGPRQGTLVLRHKRQRTAPREEARELLARLEEAGVHLPLAGDQQLGT